MEGSAAAHAVWGAVSTHFDLSPPLIYCPLTHCPCTQILKNIKGAVDARVSVAHSATILANALMHAGTSIDTFLRENLEWLSRATNWAKFSATAGLGVIHRGQLQQGACWWKRLGTFGCAGCCVMGWLAGSCCGKLWRGILAACAPGKALSAPAQVAVQEHACMYCLPPLMSARHSGVGRQTDVEVDSLCLCAVASAAVLAHAVGLLSGRPPP